MCVCVARVLWVFFGFTAGLSYVVFSLLYGWVFFVGREKGVPGPAGLKGSLNFCLLTSSPQSWWAAASRNKCCTYMSFLIIVIFIVILCLFLFFFSLSCYVSPFSSFFSFSCLFYLPIDLSIYPSMPICLSTYLSIYLSIYLCLVCCSDLI